MALLKKVKSATLMEALVATVLIVIVFVVASLVLNNVLVNTFSKNTHIICYRINELEYALQNKQLVLPYNETFEGWDIEIKQEDSKGILLFYATYNEGKRFFKKRVYAE